MFGCLDPIWYLDPLSFNTTTFFGPIFKLIKCQQPAKNLNSCTIPELELENFIFLHSNCRPRLCHFPLFSNVTRPLTTKREKN